VTADRSRSIARAALALAAALVLVRLWFVAHRAIDLDEFEHAHAAWSVSLGEVPYVDFFEHHTPALYLLFAPLFARMPVSTDARAAVDSLLICRAAMWLLTIACVASVYRLGSLWRDRLTGALAALLLVTSSQFLESMLEFRPDVPAAACLSIAVLSLMRAPDGDDRESTWVVAAGLTVAVGLLLTQKVAFAAPGFAVALLARRRLPTLVWFAVGFAPPIALTLAWFWSHDALRAFYIDNVIVNGQLNADRFSPLPRLASNIAQQPAVYLLGFAGLIACARTVNADRVVVVATAASLTAGIFAIGKAYDQYYVLLLPLLAVLGAAFVRDAAAISPPRTAIVMTLVAALSLAVSIRAYRSDAIQLAAIAWVTEHTRPSDTYLGGSPGPALFRRQAWFYGFLTGPFASAEDYATLLDGLHAGRVRPAIVIDDAYLARAPAPLLEYLRSRYRRQSEYGSLGLKISDASDKFERPLIR